MSRLDGTELAGWPTVALYVTGAAVSVLALRWWVARGGREVQRIVDDGQAQWAAFGWLSLGAEHFGGARAARGSRPNGFLTVSGGELTWQPNRRALRRRHVPVRRPLAQVKVLRTRWRRLPSGLRVREVLLGLDGAAVQLVLYTEAGVEPDEWMLGLT